MVRVLRANHRHMAEAELRLLMPRFFGRTREPFGGAMPGWWEAEAARPGPRLTFAVVDDLGPATKILGNLQAEEQEPEERRGIAAGSCYISVDDDQAYLEGTIDQLLVQHQRTPGCVLCYSGVRLIQGRARHIASALAETDLSLRPSVTAVLDLAEGFGGVLYPRSVLLGLSPLRDALRANVVPDFAMRGDDYLLSNALSNLGVPRLGIVHVPHAPGQTCKEMAHGLQADALHKIDGNEPYSRYKPIVEWMTSRESLLPPLLRDAFPRAAVAPSELSSIHHPSRAWLLLAVVAVAVVTAAAILASRAPKRSALKFSPPSRRRMGPGWFSALLAVVLAVVLAVAAIGVLLGCGPKPLRKARRQRNRHEQGTVVIGVPSQSAAAEWHKQLRRGLLPSGSTISVIGGDAPARPVHPALALLERAKLPEGLLVTIPAGASLAETTAHLNYMVERARQLPQCVIAAEGSLVVLRDPAPMLLPCPVGCAASMMDSDAGLVVYNAPALLRAKAAASPCRTDAELSAALTSAGVTILRMPDPATVRPEQRSPPSGTIPPAVAKLLNAFVRAA